MIPVPLSIASTAFLPVAFVHAFRFTSLCRCKDVPAFGASSITCQVHPTGSCRRWKRKPPGQLLAGGDQRLRLGTLCAPVQHQAPARLLARHVILRRYRQYPALASINGCNRGAGGDNWVTYSGQDCIRTFGTSASDQVCCVDLTTPTAELLARVTHAEHKPAGRC
jgi:hypothetical protein